MIMDHSNRWTETNRYIIDGHIEMAEPKKKIAATLAHAHRKFVTEHIRVYFGFGVGGRRVEWGSIMMP